MNIYEKLQKCRVELQQKKLKKSGVNKYSGFNYFELADFMPDVNILFDNYKLFSNFSIGIDGLARLIIIDCEDENSKSIEFTSPVEELELKGCNKIQALGGVHTYMKRYLYMNALEIVEADMFDSVTGKEEPKQEQAKEEEQKSIYITLAQKNQLRAKLGEAEFAQLMNKSGNKLTVEEFEKIMGAE